MVTFDGLPYPMDIIYLKVAGAKEVVSIPFTEALGILDNVSFDYRESKSKSIQEADQHYVIKGDTEKEKNKTFVVSKRDLIKRLQLDIYEDKHKIADMAIQPMDELITSEVQQFIEI